MSRLDRWPSTPVKLITAWAMSVVFFLVSMYVMLMNKAVNEAIFYTMAGVLFGTDAIAAAQFYAKRKTAFTPPETASEVTKGNDAGQPTHPVTAEDRNEAEPTMDRGEK